MASLSLVGIVVLLCVGVSFAANKTSCPSNEEYVECDTECPPTCQDKEPKACTDNCIKRCACIKGYKREAPGGMCVPDSCTGVPICTEHEKFATCGTACPLICNQTFPKICTLQCVKGCFCEGDYIRERKGGKCVPHGTCKPTCGENEEFNTCGTKCPGTCSEPTKACVKMCAVGCFCKENYLLDDKTGKCIRKEDCPVASKNKN